VALGAVLTGKRKGNDPSGRAGEATDETIPPQSLTVIFVTLCLDMLI
jgi:hypothetical protein